MKYSLVMLMITILCLTCGVGTSGMGRAYAAKSEEALRDLRKKIDKEEKIVKELEQEKSSILGSLESLDRKINQAERRQRASQTEIEKLTVEIKGLKKDLAALDKKIEVQRQASAGRLDVYYRLGRAGVLPVLFSESTMPQKIRDLEAMRRILRADRDRLQAYHALLQQKENKQGELQSRLDAELLLEERIRKRKQECVARRREKDKLVFGLEQDRKRHQQLLVELGKSAESLEKWLRDRERQQEEERLRGGGFLGSSIKSGKGGLTWPVEGRVCREFGDHYDPRYQATIRNKGIDIRTKPDTPVYAVWGGVVAYADWYRGYGKLLIVHHGGKDYSVLSHLDRLTKKEGEAVEGGELVGYAGDTGSMEGCLVHFEIWHNGQAIDPRKWVKRNTNRTSRRLE